MAPKERIVWRIGIPLLESRERSLDEPVDSGVPADVWPGRPHTPSGYRIRPAVQTRGSDPFRSLTQPLGITGYPVVAA